MEAKTEERVAASVVSGKGKARYVRAWTSSASAIAAGAGNAKYRDEAKPLRLLFVRR